MAPPFARYFEPEPTLFARAAVDGIGRAGRLPLLLARSDRAYRRLIRHRRPTGWRVRWRLGSAVPASNRGVSWVFSTALGAVYLIAFTSLRAQVLGLYGSRGIAPASETMDGARALSRDGRLRALARYPTVFWLGSSDAALLRACRAGQLLSVLLLVGVAPRCALGAAWALYLSCVTVGREFLGYQWDALLLETSLCGLAVVPPGWRARRGEWNPPRLGVLLLRWLAFRLLFQSGLAKLRSGDVTWRERTACRYHFQTQPLPTPLGWHAHQLSARVHQLATAAVLVLECCVPLLAFAPRRPRLVSWWLLMGLQGAIALTGNYGFFNLLTAVDMLWLLDDAASPRVFGVQPSTSTRRKLSSAAGRYLSKALSGSSCAAVFLMSLVAHGVSHGRRLPPRALLRVFLPLMRFRSINAYGLFAVMTTERPEIVIEGSDDGETWGEYRFRYKPTGASSAPRWSAPHQPRLDWQMWFAAMAYPPRWFAQFLVRLLEASPEVLALLEPSPFGTKPPRYVRARLYRFEMTDIETRRRTGAWWRRELIGPYFPTASLARKGPARHGAGQDFKAD